MDRAQDYLMQIVSAGYGFDVPDIQNALVQTNYESVQAAVEYLFSHQSNNNTSTNIAANTQNTQNTQDSGNASTLLQRIFGATLANTNASSPAAAQATQHTFNKTYPAYSASYWSSENRDKLECGDRIVMPPSALEELSRMNVQFPMLFNIKNTSESLPKQSHCGVLEFTAPEGSIYLAKFMMDNLGLAANGSSTVQLTSVSLPKGTSVQLQPHETKFTQLSNPRVVLEKSLRAYSCLTVGDTIHIKFANHTYKLDITQVTPDNKSINAPAAISIIETDLKVDFMEARDYAMTNAVDMVLQPQETKDVPLFLWRLTLEANEKMLLVAGYIRMILNAYVADDIIFILIKYADCWAVLDDIIKCKPYTRHESDVFDVYGVKLQLEFLANGDPNDQTNSEQTSGTNVLKVESNGDVVMGNGDNSCVLLSPTTMTQLGFFRGDSAVVKSNKQTIVIILANDVVNNEAIKINDVVRKNIGCEYGDTATIVAIESDNIRYGDNIRLSPLKDTITGQSLCDSRPFGASKYGGKHRKRKKHLSTETIANELWNNYIKQYFQDAYRPVRIGDIYKISKMNADVEFEVVDLTVSGLYVDNVCLVAPETEIFIDEPIEREEKNHIDRPSIALCLKGLPENIKAVNIKFEIEIKELNKTLLSGTCDLNHNKQKFIQKQSKRLYTNKLKDCNQITFALKIQSMKLTDLGGNAVDINEYKRKYELIAQREKEKKEELIQKSEIEALKNQITYLKELNEESKKRISGLQTENREFVNKLSIIRHEKKELEIENLELKNEIKQLKLENLNVEEYANWDSSQLIHWIVSLESERFAKYENILQSCLSQQNVDGSCLAEVDRNDIMSWGIRDFKDSKSLLNHIKSLLNGAHQNDDNSNEGASTAFH